MLQPTAQLVMMKRWSVLLVTLMLMTYLACVLAVESKDPSTTPKEVGVE